MYFIFIHLYTPTHTTTTFYSETNKIESDPENTEHIMAFFHRPCEPGGTLVLDPDQISAGTNQHSSAEVSEGFSSITSFINIALSTGPDSPRTHLLFHCLSSKAMYECWFAWAEDLIQLFHCCFFSSLFFSLSLFYSSVGIAVRFTVQ